MSAATPARSHSPRVGRRAAGRGSVTTPRRLSSARPPKPRVFASAGVPLRIPKIAALANAGVGKRAVLANVKGKREALVLALDLLVEEEYVTVEQAGSAHAHRSLRPYRQANED